jgi:GxxExxY protein
MEQLNGLLYEELSYAVIGCAQRVHGKLGPGLPESVYSRALSHEFSRQQIPHQCEVPFEVVYEEQPVGQFRVDALVGERIVLELKAVDRLCDQHEAQVITYLKASGKRLGLLINFGQRRLLVRRFAN